MHGNWRFIDVSGIRREQLLILWNEGAKQSEELTTVSSAYSALWTWEVVLENLDYEKERSFPNILGHFLADKLDTLLELIANKEVFWTVDTVQEEVFRVHDLPFTIFILTRIDVSDPAEKVHDKLILLHDGSAPER